MHLTINIGGPGLKGDLPDVAIEVLEEDRRCDETMEDSGD